MSLRVLVIPEDPSWNGYILKPLVERLLEECGKHRAFVQVLTSPRAKGYEHAKGLIRDGELTSDYRHMDLWLFLPDGDNKDRQSEFDGLEDGCSRAGIRLICCAAIPEVEAWLMAGHTDKMQTPWKDIRASSKLRTEHFEAFLKAHGNLRAPGQGRGMLMRETLGNYKGLKSRCPELQELEDKVRNFLDDT